MQGGWKKTLGLLLAALTMRAASGEDEPYKDLTLPFEKRAADLAARMTLEERADQMQITMPANAKYGIQAMRWGGEGLHGIAGSTMYPDATAMGATFDPALIKQIGAAIGEEARARANGSGAANPGGSGLVLWCPTVNMVRDPRWGRNMETFGEDPYLSGKLGAAYCSGMQGDDPKYLKVIATPKHYVVYSQELQRNSVNAMVSQRALHEYYLPAFEACFMEGHAASTMSAYNAVNGIPCSCNEYLLTKVLRDQWQWQGVVCTDSRAVNMIFSGHRYTDNEEAAVADAINAGVDIITDSAQARITPLIVQAENDHLLKAGATERAARNSLLAKFRLGLFDPPANNPYAQLRVTPEMTQAHVTLALKAARETVTLLQNNEAPRGFGVGKLLPLDLRRVASVAIVGPYAPYNLYGSYAQVLPPPGGTGTPEVRYDNRGPSPIAALQAALGDRVQVRAPSSGDYDAQVEAARVSDVVIFIGGNDTRADRSGTDRSSLDMPGDQLALLARIEKVNPLIVMVVTGGAALNLEPLKSKCPAILMSWYNGEQGGNALAEVLLGKVNPAGRLPVTFYKSANDVPAMSDYEVITGRTYMYCQKAVCFPFGHGLSYTSFGYDDLTVVPADGGKLPPKVGGDSGSITVSFTVANAGERDGDEVAQLYVRQVSPKITRPIKQLVAMSRVTIAKGDKKTVKFTVPLKSLAYWDTEHSDWAVDSGAYEVMVGASSEDIRLKQSIELE